MLQGDDWSELLHRCFTVLVTVAVVAVVDSLELELDEEYPDGETGSGVRLRGDPGDGDGNRSIHSLRLRSFAGVGGLFLTGLKGRIRCEVVRPV